MSIQSAVQAALEGRLQPGEPVLAGVSGGADSVALLHLLIRLGWRPHVCHLNHGWRGAESDADAAFVRDLADEWELPFTGEAEDRIEQTEEAAREARFAFFESAARATGIRKLVLGHTADDQVETFIMRLLRGSGVPGLVGIWPDRQIGSLRVFRPLLNADRNEIVAYLKANQLGWREDRSNQDPRFLRNRIRTKLIPLLEREYNPALREVLRRTTQILRDEDFFLLRDVAQRFYLRICRENAVHLDALLAQPTAVQRRVLRFWLGGENEHCGALFSYEHIEAIRALALGEQPGAEIHLPQELVVYREYDRLYKATASDFEPITNEWPVTSEGTTRIPQLGVVFHVIPQPADGATISRTMTNQVSCGTSHHKEIGQDGSSKDGLCEEWFDAHTLGPDLMVRTWQPGDRFQPLGMAQEKKLQDFFVDQKVPRRQRQRIPLLVASDERIAWVIGQRIAEPFKVTSKSAAVLRVVCEHDDSDRPK